ncbi:MAG: type I DNA topoisomerase [Clostridiales bacterium]|nr:type I DNA topoisomerase [Clostridiales bacterium]
MSDYLVIVESPAKSKTIGKFLGKKYNVQASAGHIRDLPKSQFGIDIDNNFQPKYLNIRGKADLINKLKKEAKEAKKVYLATDPDREGEAISWHLANILGIDENDKCRVTFNEITKTAVNNAFKNPRQIDLELVNAQQARRVLDRIVGYKISPVLWKKVRKGLSAGRVQSVATRIICDREDEIEKFEPKEFWTITATLNKFDDKKPVNITAKFYGLEKKKIVPVNEKEAKEILEKIRNGEYNVASIKKSEKKRMPSAPFTTSTLQQEASRKLSFSATKTMLVAQQLYEGIDIKGEGAVGLVTYIRTDSTRISDEAETAAKDYILANYGKEFLPLKPPVYKNKNSSQDAHEAIRPTYLELDPETVKNSLTNDQYKLYKLIWLRFIASQMTAGIIAVCVVDIGVNEYIFRATGSTVTFPGFMKIYEEGKDDEEEDENKKLPELEVGEKLKLINLEPKQNFTQPPPRYTEATLVKALEEKGIGRPSTYAPTITTILQRGYVIKDKKILAPTELGRIINDLMKKNFQDIVNVEFTASIENKLDEVEQGTCNWVDMLRDFYTGFEVEVEKAEKEIEHIKLEDPVSDVPCDKCGRMMVIKTGRYGKFLACPGFPECRNTKNIVEEAGVNCPECGKPLIYRKTKTGRRYVSCSGYPDCKFTSWNLPTGTMCPKCGKFLVYQFAGKNRKIVCSNKDCDYTEVLIESNEEEL